MENSTENMTSIQELELMRQQLAFLKEKVSKQQLVNEKYMRQIMHDKVKKINNDALIIGILGIVAIIYCTWIFLKLVYVSTAFIVVTDVFLAIAVVYNTLSHWGLKAKDLLNGNLIQTRRKVTHMKLMGTQWLRFGIPFSILWFAWFCYEILKHNTSSTPSGKYMIIGGMVGGIVGGVLGYRAYRKSQRQAIEVIEEIEELTHEQ